MEECNIDKRVVGVRTCLKNNSGRFGTIPVLYRKELGLGRQGGYVLLKLMSNGILLTPHKPKMGGYRRKVDRYGRMGSIPLEFREKLGIDYPGAELEIILLKEGVLLRPVGL